MQELKVRSGRGRSSVAAIAIGALLLAGISGTSASAATPKPGAKCTPFHKVVTIKNLKYTCIKSGKKLVWSKGVKTVKAVAIGCTLPPSINLVAIKDMTGTSAFVGLEAVRGIQLAAQQVDSQRFLGGTKLAIDYQDPAGDPQTAISEVTSAVNNKKVSAILGPVLSNQAIAASPIAQKGKTPIIYTQAGSDGVLIGDYTFRANPPLYAYYSTVLNWLKTKNVKTVSIIYSADNPTLTQLATEVIPQGASKFGYTVKATNAVTAATQDFATPIGKTVDGNPDAIALLVLGSQVPSAVQQIALTGYKGLKISYPAVGSNLSTVAAAGKGITWATNYVTTMSDDSSRNFTSNYKAKYGTDPSNYAAEAYDSLWWVARAIQNKCSASRSGIRAGLVAVAHAGFAGAQGQITFQGNDARVQGALVEWNGSGISQVK